MITKAKWLQLTRAIAASHPLAAELQSLLHGVTVCLTKNLNNIILKGDCLVLVENLRSMDNIQWDCMPTWKKLLESPSHLDKWEINFCRRSQNEVADMLAKSPPPIFAVFSIYLPWEAYIIYAKEKQSSQYQRY